MSAHKHDTSGGTDGAPYWVGNTQYQRYYCSQCTTSTPIVINTR